ncbi:alpha-hydroxy-acid oxidizing protein [Pseudomonas sp. KNUC1026]|uniref:alpha-hydroxy-acid oxidizing protein n=1 Tax=Pseudomonas sp. KNUC1026 TaxID=2893890 RepID=UPI001F2A7594|nr:alpha-hydroxy-acid oxidizing protein [Pseudomonas sp. KNUC1026]UFH51702.1 alpha-hydroxy-acid oxidizing protein [Pseudomonas sp. KNUC1026]
MRFDDEVAFFIQAQGPALAGGQRGVDILPCLAAQANTSAFGQAPGCPTRGLQAVLQQQLDQRQAGGHTYGASFGIAAMGISALSAYQGDLIQAQAAAEANIPTIMSGSSLIRMETIVQANPNAWFQASVPGVSEKILALLVVNAPLAKTREWLVKDRNPSRTRRAPQRGAGGG